MGPSDVQVIFESNHMRHNYLLASPTARPYPRNGHAVGDAEMEPVGALVGGHQEEAVGVGLWADIFLGICGYFQIFVDIYANRKRLGRGGQCRYL